MRNLLFGVCLFMAGFIIGLSTGSFATPEVMAVQNDRDDCNDRINSAEDEAKEELANEVRDRLEKAITLKAAKACGNVT